MKTKDLLIISLLLAAVMVGFAIGMRRVRLTDMPLRCGHCFCRRSYWWRFPACSP